MARPVGGASKFASINLNESYGKQVQTNSSIPGSGNGAGTKSRLSGSTHGGMLLLTRPGRPQQQQQGQKNIAKLTVPAPVNLPSLRREHAGNDPTVSLVGGGSSGWSKQQHSQQEEVGAGNNGELFDAARQKSPQIWRQLQQPLPADGDSRIQGNAAKSGTYTPPAARVAGAGAGPHNAGFPPPSKEKAVLLRGEDFPSLQATVPLPVAPSQQRLRDLNQRQRDKQREQKEQQNRLHQLSQQTQKKQEESAGESSGQPTQSLQPQIKQEELKTTQKYSPGEQLPSKDNARAAFAIAKPAPLIHLHHTSNWADDERETLPRSGNYPDMPLRDDESRQLRRLEEPGHGHVQFQMDGSQPVYARRDGMYNGIVDEHLHGRFNNVRDAVHSRENLGSRDSEASSRDWNLGKVNMTRDVKEGFYGRPSSFNRENLINGRSFSFPRANGHGRERDVYSNGTNGYREGFSRDANRIRDSNGKDKIFSRRSDYEGSRYTERIGRRGIDMGNPYSEDPFRDFPDLPGLGLGFESFESRILRKKKDDIKEDKFHDPEREFFETELERVQQQLEEERQRKIEERERAVELARKEQEERERLAREEEEKQRRLEEEAREAVVRAEQEALESVRKVEEARRAREEEKRREMEEEEKRKENARRKLLELEERMAKREAERKQKEAEESKGNGFQKEIEEDRKPNISGMHEGTCLKHEETTRFGEQACKEWDDDMAVKDAILDNDEDERAPLRFSRIPSSKPKNLQGELGRLRSPDLYGNFDIDSNTGLSARGFDDRSKSFSWRREANKSNPGTSPMFGAYHEERSMSHERLSNSRYGDWDTSYSSTNAPPRAPGDSTWKERTQLNEWSSDDEMRAPMRSSFSGRSHFSGTDQGLLDGDRRWGRQKPEFRYAKERRPETPPSPTSYFNGPDMMENTYGRLRQSLPKQPRVLPPLRSSIQRPSAEHRQADVASEPVQAPNQNADTEDHLVRLTEKSGGDNAFASGRGTHDVEHDYGKGEWNSGSDIEDSSPRDGKSGSAEDTEVSMPSSGSQDSFAQENERQAEVHSEVLRSSDREGSPDQHVTMTSCSENEERVLEMVAEFTTAALNEDGEQNIHTDESEFDEQDTTINKDLIEEENDYADDSNKKMEDSTTMKEECAQQCMQENSMTEEPAMVKGVNVDPNELSEAVPVQQIGEADGSHKQEGDEQQHHLHDHEFQPLASNICCSPSTATLQTMQAEMYTGRHPFFPQMHQMAMPLQKTNMSPASAHLSAVLESAARFHSHQELPLTLQFGLLPGTSLFQAPLPAIQIGSIQMPLQLHPQVSPQVTHLQAPPFQFGQLGSVPTFAMQQPPMMPPMGIDVPSHGQGQQNALHQSISQMLQGSQQLVPPRECMNQVLASSVPQATDDKILAHGQSSKQADDSQFLNMSVDNNPTKMEENMNEQLVAPRGRSRTGQPHEFGPVGRGKVKPEAVQDGIHGTASASDSILSSGDISQGKLVSHLSSNSDSKAESHTPIKQGRAGNLELDSTNRKELSSSSSLRESHMTESADNVHNMAVRKDIERAESDRQQTTNGKHGAGIETVVMQVLEQPGLDPRSDDDDFIEVRSKRQMLNERREQRDRQGKVKPKDTKGREQAASKQKSTPKQGVQADPSASSVVRVPTSTRGDRRSGFESSVMEMNSKASHHSTRPFVPLLGPESQILSHSTHEANFDKSPKGAEGNLLASGNTNVEPEVLNEASSHTSPTNAVWGANRPNNQVVSITQIQLEEAMKPARFEVTVPQQLPLKSLNTALEPLPTMKEKSASPAAGPVTSLLAGEKIQFGAVTLPAFVSPVSRPPSSALGAVGSPVSSRSDGSHDHRKKQATGTENEMASFDAKGKRSRDNDVRVDSEAEAEAAASAIAVAAMSIDDSMSNTENSKHIPLHGIIGTSGLKGSLSNSSTNLNDMLLGAPATRSATPLASVSEDSMAVTLPADLSVDMPILHRGPASTGLLLPSLPAGLPGGHPSFPAMDMGTMLGAPMFAFSSAADVSAGLQGPNTGLVLEQGNTNGPNMGAWQPQPSGVDSFYGGPPSYGGPFMGPAGAIPPHMLVYTNPFAPVGQFGQLGVSFMGPPHMPSGKQPDWKHNPVSASSGLVGMSVGDIGPGAGMLYAQRSSGLGSSIQHLVHDPSVISVLPPSGPFDMHREPFQMQSQWTHLSGMHLHHAPVSGASPGFPVQGRQPCSAPPFMGHLHSAVDANSSSNIIPMTDPPNSSFDAVDAAPQFPEELGLGDLSSSSSVSYAGQQSRVVTENAVNSSASLSKLRGRKPRSIRANGGLEANASEATAPCSGGQIPNGTRVSLTQLQVQSQVQTMSAQRPRAVDYVDQKSSSQPALSRVGNSNSWSGQGTRKGGLQGRSQLGSLGDKSFVPSTKLKQVYVVKPSAPSRGLSANGDAANMCSPGMV